MWPLYRRPIGGPAVNFGPAVACVGSPVCKGPFYRNPADALRVNFPQGIELVVDDGLCGRAPGSPAGPGQVETPTRSPRGRWRGSHPARCRIGSGRPGEWRGKSAAGQGSQNVWHEAPFPGFSSVESILRASRGVKTIGFRTRGASHAALHGTTRWSGALLPQAASGRRRTTARTGRRPRRMALPSGKASPRAHAGAG